MPDVHVLELAALTQEETGEQLGMLGVDAGRVDAIYARTLGQPLFTEQLVADSSGEQVPAYLADLLDRRLGEVDDAAWVVARTLGVADRPIPVALLAAAADLARDDLTAGLHVLADRHLLLDHADDDHVALRHPLVAEAVRRRLVPGEGRPTHRGIALALAADDSSEPAEVASHWRAGGDTSGELPWQVRAACAAARRFADDQAADHWLRALEIWPAGEVVDSVTRGEAEGRALEALEYAGHEDRALSRALRLLAEPGGLSDDERFQVGFLAAAYTWGQTGPDVALDRLDEVLEAYPGAVPDRLLVKTLPLRANLLAAVGRYDESLPCLDRALTICQDLDDRSWMSATLASLVWHRGVTGDLDGAREAAHASRQALGDALTARREVGIAMMLTDVLLFHARPAEELLDAASKALTMIRDLDISATQAHMVRCNTALGLIQGGRVASAAEVLPPEAGDSRDYSAWPLRLAAARLAVARGQLDAALAHLEGGRRQADHLSDTEHAVPAAEAMLWLGRPAEAVDLLLRLLEGMATSPASRFAAMPTVLLARSAADAASLRLVDPSLRDRLVALRRGAHTDPLGPGVLPASRPAATEQWGAELARLDGTATVDHWGRAASAWDRLSRPHDSAYCRWRAAQVALREGNRTVAARLLKRAARDAREHVPLSEAIARTTGAAP